MVASGPAPADAPAKLRPVEDTGVRMPPDLVELALDLADALRHDAGPDAGARAAADAAPRLALWAERGAGRHGRAARASAAVLDALRSGPAAARGAAGRDRRRGGRRAPAGGGGRAARLRAVAARGGRRSARGRALTTAQAAAVDRIARAMDAAEPLLLHGVTGAGKTEVFLHAIARCLEPGRGAIVLVPEIALAPQTAGRISGALRRPRGGAALGAGRRARGRPSTARIRRGEARVVVGPRSAIFAPLDEIGLIVVDEEHDGAYKQESDPRYDARAVALLRAREHGAAVRATRRRRRGAESWHALERIVAAGAHRRPAAAGRRSSTCAATAPIRSRGRCQRRPWRRSSDEGGRAVLLLNRRGEAPALHCRGCGVDVRAAPDCDVALTLHAQPAALLCHHCGRRRAGSRGAARAAAPSTSRASAPAPSGSRS